MLKPDNSAVSDPLMRWVADVENAAKSGNWAQATSWAERALSLGFQHPRLLQFRAMARDRAGRSADAIADLQRAYTLDAEDVGIANALGSSLTRARRFDEASRVLQAEASARPDVPETWFNLAAARMAAGDIEKAREAFEQAAALRPDFAEALGKLAVLAAHRGDAAAASAYAARALALSPDNPDARRAAIEAAIQNKRAPDAERAARDWIAQPGLGPNGRSHAFGLLADALELQGRHAEAFRAYTASKAAFAEANAGAYRGLDVRPLAITLSDMQREFAAMPTDRWAKAPARTPQTSEPRTHVFLMGFMRSGTTLLEQALSRHPDVVALEETEAMAEAGAAWLGTPDGFERIAGADAATLESWRAAYGAAVRAAGVEPAGKVLIDKLPFNVIKLPLIARLFPEARILFAIRDPRDVVLSCFQKRLQPNSFSYEMRTLEGAARFYAAYMALARAYRAALPLAILDHRHEALLADFGASVSEACAFIGLDFRPEMTAFQVSAEAGRVMSQTARQLQGGLNAKGLGRWRAYANEIAPVLPILRPWTEAFGYDP
jgi:Flp pilus assembly protein TadD